MRVVSVNRASVGVIRVRNDDVPTGMFKQPVTGPVTVDADGIRGDAIVVAREQGRVDQALCVMPQEHVDHWRAVLGRSDLGPGFLGENLSTRGVLETEVRIGERWRIGTVVLEVSHPRMPCRKLDARMGQAFQGRFLRSRRVGFYLRVVQTGTINTGDTIAVEERPPGAPTIDDVVRLSTRDAWDIESLERVLSDAPLTARARVDLEDVRERSRAAEGWFGGRPMRITQRTEEGPGMVSLRLACSAGRPLAPFKGGQHLTVVHRRDDDGRALRRAYAISSPPGVLDHYRITVRAQASHGHEPGVVSNHLVQHAAVGDELTIHAPAGHFVLPPGSNPCVMLGWGIGVAPLLAMVHGRAGNHGTMTLHALGRSVPASLWEETLQLARTRTDLRVHRAGEDVDPDDVEGVMTEEHSAVTRYAVAGGSLDVQRCVAALLKRGVKPEQVAQQEFGRFAPAHEFPLRHCEPRHGGDDEPAGNG